MKRPTWATAVGIIGIILGCMSVLGSCQSLMAPRIIAFQREMMSTMEVAVEREMQRSNAPQQVPAREMVTMMRQMMDMPDWWGTWNVVTGGIGLIVAVVYITACVRLLQVAPSGISLFYDCAGARILLSIANGGAALFAAPVVLWGVIPAMGFSVAVHAVLLLVVATADKTAFRPAATTAGAGPGA